MGRPRAVLQLELQPVAQVHSELRSEGDRYQALLPGHATVPVERCGSYQSGRAYHLTHDKVTVTTYRCHQAMSQVAQMRITSAPLDDGPSVEDVIVVNSDDTTLR